LYCLKWTKGVGALIITPTRELAYQINETLQNIGKYHDFSASLVIGMYQISLQKNLTFFSFDMQSISNFIALQVALITEKN